MVNPEILNAANIERQSLAGLGGLEIDSRHTHRTVIPILFFTLTVIVRNEGVAVTSSHHRLVHPLAHQTDSTREAQRTVLAPIGLSLRQVDGSMPILIV